MGICTSSDSQQFQKQLNKSPSRTDNSIKLWNNILLIQSLDDLKSEQFNTIPNLNEKLRQVQVIIFKLFKCVNVVQKLNEWMDTYGIYLNPQNLKSLYFIMEQEPQQDRSDPNCPYLYFNIKSNTQGLFSNFVKLGLAQNLEVLYLDFENNLANSSVNLQNHVATSIVELLSGCQNLVSCYIFLNPRDNGRQKLNNTLCKENALLIFQKLKQSESTLKFLSLFMDFSWCKKNNLQQNESNLFCKNLKSLILFMSLDKNSTPSYCLFDQFAAQQLEDLEISIIFPVHEDEKEAESEILQLSTRFYEIKTLENYTLILGYLKDLQFQSAANIARTIKQYNENINSHLKSISLIFSSTLITQQTCKEIAIILGQVQNLNSLVFRCNKPVDQYQTMIKQQIDLGQLLKQVETSNENNEPVFGLFAKEYLVQFLDQINDFKQTKNYNSFMNVIIELMQQKEMSIVELAKNLKSQNIFLVQGNDNLDYILMSKLFHELKNQTNSLGQQFRIILSQLPQSMTKIPDLKLDDKFNSIQYYELLDVPEFLPQQEEKKQEQQQQPQQQSQEIKKVNDEQRQEVKAQQISAEQKVEE